MSQPTCESLMRKESNMADQKFETEVKYHIYDNDEGVSLAVGPCPDFPGNVLFRTPDKAAAEYFGEQRLSLGTGMMRRLAQAMLRACDEADQRYPEYSETGKPPRGEPVSEAGMLTHAIFQAGFAAGVIQKDLPELTPTGGLQVLEGLVRALKKAETAPKLQLGLTNDGRGSGFSATAQRSGDGDIYREIAVDVHNQAGNLVASMVVGLNATTLQPQISMTADGQGEGEMKININPMLPSEEAVTLTDIN